MSLVDRLRARRAIAARPLPGRVVAITGGARGLGLATARAAAAKGARIAIGDLDGDLAELEAAKLPGPGPHAGFKVDVTDEDSFAAFVDSAEKDLGPLDVIVNNAGIMLVGPFVDEDPAITIKQTEINITGVMRGTRLALTRMIPRGTGHVVNIASAAGKTGLAGEATYCATKHAVVGFNESLHIELKGTGVNVTTVLPGLANTELAAGMNAGRGVSLIEPEDVADAIVAALERPRLNVFVPKRLDVLFRSQSLMPVRIRDFVVQHGFQTDKIGTDVDWQGRQRYMQRAAAAGDAHASGDGDSTDVTEQQRTGAAA